MITVPLEVMLSCIALRHVCCDLKILGADKQVLNMQAFSRAHLQICKKGIVLQLN